MKNLVCKILFVAAIFAATTSVSAQTLMCVHLNDGSIISALVANIDSVTWAATDIGQNNEGATSVTGVATNITKNSATISAFANGILDNLATEIRVGIIYTSNGTPTWTNGTIIDVNTNTIASDGSYSITLTGLHPETTYSYRSFVFQSGIWFYGDIRTFTTTGSGEMFTTGTASDVTCFSASVAASVNVDASVPYSTLSYGICYGTTIDPSTNGLHTEAQNRDISTGEFTVILRGLYGGTTYYYRPYAVIDGVIKYGQSSQFRTLDDNVVETVSVDVEAGTATGHLLLGNGFYQAIKLGFCYGRTEVPTINDMIITTDEVDNNRNYTVQLPQLNDLYYLRAFILIDGTPHYGNIINASFSKLLIGEAIDLGLSVMWSSMNIGATSPEGYGDYFAWGETQPKSVYNYNTYKWCQGKQNTMTKYCCDSEFGFVDNKSILEEVDDAATVIWGSSWRTPTIDELSELNTLCDWTWTTQNGIKGFRVTGPNGNSIFLPASGSINYSGNYTKVTNAGTRGAVWSSSLYEDNNDAYVCSYEQSLHGTHFFSGRFCGLTIRPVRDF